MKAFHGFMDIGITSISRRYICICVYVSVSEYVHAVVVLKAGPYC